jgi:transglutaminase-like putative cysteine protease
MTFRIIHTTRYQYTQAVTQCHSEAHLQPRATERQRCVSALVHVDPPPAVYQGRCDYFGNPVLYFAVQQPHDTLTVTATSTVHLCDTAPLPIDTPSWEEVRSRVQGDGSPAGLESRELVLDSPLASGSAELALLAAPSFPRGRPLLEAVDDLNRRIHREFTYDPHFSTVSTPLVEVLASRRGVCQDFAHVAIACLRSLGLPARYVSGYVESVPPAGAPPRLGGAASHAWFGVHVPDLGWIDFDPTNNQLVTRQHVTLAWGRDYADVTPLKGVVVGGGAHSLEVAVEMSREAGSPDAHLA